MRECVSKVVYFGTEKKNPKFRFIKSLFSKEIYFYNNNPLPLKKKN